MLKVGDNVKYSIYVDIQEKKSYIMENEKQMHEVYYNILIINIIIFYFNYINIITYISALTTLNTI